MSYTKLPMTTDGQGYANCEYGIVAEFMFLDDEDGNEVIDIKEAEANARLFVHAGKMLEMLEIVAKQDDHDLESYKWQMELREKITNLIAAAKGEA